VFGHASVSRSIRWKGVARYMKVRRGLAAEQALQIARLVAEAAYGDLDDFRMSIARQADG
jgi:hypothetical protein